MDKTDPISKGGGNQLPEIPANPDAPVAGWIHYGITRYVDTQIRNQITTRGWAGRKHLLGLKISYEFGHDKRDHSKTYAMEFGEEIGNGEKVLLDELGLEFWIQLFHDVSQYFDHYNQQGGGIQNLMMCSSVGDGGGTSSISIICWPCTEHAEHRNMNTLHLVTDNEEPVCLSAPCR